MQPTVATRTEAYSTVYPVHRSRCVQSQGSVAFCSDPSEAGLKYDYEHVYSQRLTPLGGSSAMHRLECSPRVPKLLDR